VGFFLVEAMRLANLTLHNSDILKKFAAKFESIGPCKGQTADCIAHATFNGLAYMKNDGGYVYMAI
jgi:hypothetical protein